MKKIEAFIREEQVEPVAYELRSISGLSGMTVTRGEGFGRPSDGNEFMPTPEMVHDFRKVVRIEVFCNDALAETVVKTIEQTAHTGLRHDGKIYILAVEEAVRISTGVRGEQSV